MNVSEELDTIANTEENAKGENQTNSNITRKERNKLCRLPLARVKHIMKMDPECSIISQDAVVLVTKATVSVLLKSYAIIHQQFSSSGTLCRTVRKRSS